MQVSEFEDHLDRYGGDLAAWPAALRVEATRLIDTSPAANAALRTMVDVEAVLQRPLVASSSGAANAMAARAMQHRQIRPIPVAVRRTGWVGAAAAALVLGLFVGNLTPRHEENPANVMAAAFDGSGTVDVD